MEMLYIESLSKFTTSSSPHTLFSFAILHGNRYSREKYEKKECALAVRGSAYSNFLKLSCFEVRLKI